MTQKTFQPGTLVTVMTTSDFVELYSSHSDDGVLRYQYATHRTFLYNEIAIVVTTSLTGAPSVRPKAYIMCPAGIGWVYSDVLVKV